jgi:tripartite-type tricarboxylate transporter receptor subunit TctC
LPAAGLSSIFGASPDLQENPMFRRAVAALVFTLVSAGAFAQGYPNKTIRLVVGFTPGGVSDVLARALSARLSPNLGQQVVVDNRPGAGTTIAAEFIAKSAPDGYTLYFADATTHAINASLYRKLPYDSVRDFTYISLVASTPLLLVVNPALPAHSVAELIALAKARSGQLNYASSGTGTIVHLAGEIFKTLAHVEMVHVPYKGSSPAVTAVMAGDVALLFSSMPAALPFAKSGKLRALAVTTPRRVAAVQDVPTIAESGFPGFELVLYNGIIGPAGMQRDATDRIHAELAKVLSLPDVKEFFAAQGATPISSTPEEFAAHMRAEVAKLGKAVKDSGAQAD